MFASFEGEARTLADGTNAALRLVQARNVPAGTAHFGMQVCSVGFANSHVPIDQIFVMAIAR